VYRSLSQAHRESVASVPASLGSVSRISEVF
jgi:hypothetical protein